LGRAAILKARALRPIEHQAKNAILFLGDGMGVSTLTAARVWKGQLEGKSGEEGSLSFEQFPNAALIKVRVH
jgi:alkaline phosphatase